MGRKDKDLKSSIQRVKAEDEKAEAEVMRDDNGNDDDDTEANEDLSLKIVERAILLKECDAKINNKNGAVMTLKDVEKVTNLMDDLSQVKVKKVIKKVKKKVKKVETMETETDLVSSGKDDGFKSFCGELFEAEEAKQEEKIEGADDKDVEIIDNVVQTSLVDNHVLQKLLRGPRYFDPPENGWGTCYNCGEEGHTTVNCTSARRKKPCFVCGSLEHNARQCNKGQNCFICKKNGHHAKDCLDKKEGSQNSKLCLKCGENGHDMFTCRGDYCLDDLKEIQCYVCGEFGHLCCKNCPDTGPRLVSCYRCGYSDHTGLSCKRARGETTTGSGLVSSCFKCGKEGHFARECSNSKPLKRSNQGSTPKRKSVKSRRDNSEITTPSPYGKGHKKKKTNYEERFSSSSKSKHKHGWTSEHPGDYHINSNGRTSGWVPPTTPPPYNNGVARATYATPSYSNGVDRRVSPVTPYIGGRWGSPATPTPTPYNNGWGVSPATPYNHYPASAHASTSYPSRYNGSSNYNGSSSSNGYRHGHSASHFSHNSSRGTGKHYRWQ